MSHNGKGHGVIMVEHDDEDEVKRGVARVVSKEVKRI